MPSSSKDPPATQEQTLESDLEVDSDVGNMGEAAFGLLCAHVKATTHPGHPDARGFDFVAWLPHGTLHDGSGAKASEASSLSCYFQIKATRRHVNAWSVKLSNWKYLLDIPLPAFFLIMRFDEGAIMPASLHLIHVDPGLMSQAYRRLCEVSLEQESNLHHKTMDVTWDDSNILEGFGGTALLRKVLPVVPSLPEYCASKLETLKDLGYSGPKNELSLKLVHSTKDNINNMLADFAVGLKATLEPTSFTLTSRRSGARREITNVNTDDGTRILLTQSVLSARRGRVSFLSGGRYAAFDCTWYAASDVFRFLPAELNRIRFDSPLISFVIEPESGVNFLSCEGQMEMRCPIRHMAALGVLISLSGTPVTFRTETGLETEEGYLRERSGLTYYVNQSLTSLDLANIVGALDNAWEVAKFFDCADAESTINDILDNSESFETAMSIIRSLRAGRSSIAVNAEATAGWYQKNKRKARICIPQVLSLQLGDERCLLCVCYSGAFQGVEKIGERVKFSLASIEVHLLVKDRWKTGLKSASAPSLKRLLREWARANELALVPFVE